MVVFLIIPSFNDFNMQWPTVGSQPVICDLMFKKNVNVLKATFRYAGESILNQWSLQNPFTWGKKSGSQVGRSFCFVCLCCKTALEANNKGSSYQHRCQGIIYYTSKFQRVKRQNTYKNESNLSRPPPAPAAAPDSGSVPLHSGRSPGKSRCPPGSGHCLWKPEAAYTFLCVPWRDDKCQSLHRCQSPSPVSAGGCRLACPRWRRTRDPRLHVFLGSCCVPARSWCRFDCRWTPDGSVSSFSSCLGRKVVAIEFTHLRK